MIRVQFGLSPQNEQAPTMEERIQNFFKEDRKGGMWELPPRFGPKVITYQI